MKTYKIEEVEDILLGTRGTTQREYYEQELDEFYIGEAIRQARLSKNLTQEELGARIGVQSAQISRIQELAHLYFNLQVCHEKRTGIEIYLSAFFRFTGNLSSVGCTEFLFNEVGQT